jgi:DNA-binding transcriptional LysR family regulator
MSNLRTIDLNLLKVFDALIDEGSVTRAAARLSLTQPAVSGSLTRLREGFNDPLFVRTRRGIVPTTHALALAAQVKRVLSDVECMLQPASFDPGQATLTISIAATDYAQRAVLVPFLAVLRARAPGIRVSVLPANPELVQTQLERGELDLALMTPETTSPDLHSQVLFDEHYVCALREGHPYASPKRLSLARFCSLDHAIVSYSGGAFRGATDEALARVGRTRRVSLSVPCFLVLPEILRTSDLIAVAPSRLIAGSPGLVAMTPPVDIAGFTKIVTWHDRTHNDPAHAWVRAVLLETCGP